MVIRPSRHKPQVGDLFVLNMLGARWVAGRVVRTDATAFGSDNRLLYFYRMEVLNPDEIATPIKPDLLIAPVITNDLGWRRGYYAHLRNVSLQPEELLPRHVFESNLFPIGDPRRFQDEYRRPTAPPEPGPPPDFDGHRMWSKPWNPPPPPGLPCGSTGLAGYGLIDIELSRALGISEKTPSGQALDSSAGTGVEDDSGEYEVALHLPPTKKGEGPDLDDLEEDLIAAMEESGAGRWEGHGTDLRTGFFDIRFLGAEVEPMVKVLRPVLRRAAKRLPSGWYLTSCAGGGAQEQRIDLPY